MAAARLTSAGRRTAFTSSTATNRTLFGCQILGSQSTRQFHQTRSILKTPGVEDAEPDKRYEKNTSPPRDKPPQPKITNSSVPGIDKDAELTEEQKKEVEQHNKEFDKKHDRATSAADDKVDKKFWRGAD